MNAFHGPPARAEAIAQAHDCPVPQCLALCSPGHIACRRHWRQVPQCERDPLIAAFQQRSSDPVGFGLACEQARSLIVRYAELLAA